MITIEQLLESVDLDFEPRFVTKDEKGYVGAWSKKPEVGTTTWYYCSKDTVLHNFGKLKLSEFADKDWQECIYEVPQKTTGKIKRLKEASICKDGDVPSITSTVNVLNIIINRLNDVIDAVNELKGANQ